jgi:hypothetical protein
VIVISTASHWLEEGVLERAQALVPSVELIAVTPVALPEKRQGSRGSDVAAVSRNVHAARQSSIEEVGRWNRHPTGSRTEMSSPARSAPTRR